MCKFFVVLSCASYDCTHIAFVVDVHSVKAIVRRKKIPNLSQVGDVAEVITSGGWCIFVPSAWCLLTLLTHVCCCPIICCCNCPAGLDNASDSEMEEEISKVELPEGLAGRRRKKGGGAPGQFAVKLAEIGPRMSLKLAKVESGMATGDVLYHAFCK